MSRPGPVLPPLWVARLEEALTFTRVVLSSLRGWLLLPLITVWIWVKGQVLRWWAEDEMELHHALAKEWGRLIVRSVGLTVRIEGEENLARWLDSGPAVLVANHVSMLDIPVLLSCLPGRFAFVAKIEVFSIPLLGPFCYRAGYIPLKRGHREEATRTLLSSVNAIHDGRSPLMFPEGTRTHDGSVGHFKRGAIVLAARTGRPVLPMAICGMFDHMPRVAWLCRPGEVVVRIGPLTYLGTPHGDEDGLVHATDQVHDVICQLAGTEKPRPSAPKAGAVRPMTEALADGSRR